MKSTKLMLAVLLLMILGAWSSQSSQGLRIQGAVTDAQAGKPLAGVTVKIKDSSTSAVTDFYGAYEILVPSEKAVLVFSLEGYKTLQQKVGNNRVLDVKLDKTVESKHQAISMDVEALEQAPAKSEQGGVTIRLRGISTSGNESMPYPHSPQHNTEEYATIHESGFLEALKNPLSTFSIDVDKASYSNIRRYIQQGQQPPKDAVRIEELVNYFSYDFPEPKGDDPFALHTEISDCPWNPQHKLVHIGLQGKRIPTENLPPSNLVFLLDVSGSMDEPNRLPLVKQAFRLLVQELRPQDQVSIVVYAGAAGMVLPPTSGEDKKTILAAIDRLQAGGSTAGGEGIKLAYKIAEENFRKGGNNRIILATDGDFNVGVSSTSELERLVAAKRETGVFLTVLGFGMGNYKDGRMEVLADKGNGNYAYIDNLLEAKKVFVNEFGGTLFTIAKDVKLQLEFNPAKVQGYRLLGYENRILNKEDFNNDKKDAGELGSGHTVTALYEIIPVGVKDSPFLNQVDPLKYQKQEAVAPKASRSEELFTLKLRYKQPDGKTSKKLELPVADRSLSLAQTSDNFRFAASVAAFGMLLRDSEFKGNATYAEVLNMAKGAKGKDEEGYRAEFINMVRSMELVAER